jgi:8-oxo-dGTP pyrophosphatase MutT (NUDIX family)
MNYCEKDFIDQIRSILSSRKRRVIEHPPFSHAAVLVPLFQRDGDCHLLFTKRSEEVKYHKGEISFPGGVVDEEDLELRIISRLVDKSLNDLQRKVSQIMVAIGFAFDNFDFVIYAFQDSGMDGIVAMVENPVPITAKHLGEPGYLGMIQSSG